jgi:2-polyprenyl-3-methyl-5-hydroxy-6-metoxy-1,4-benzoquinol methylase
MSNIEIWDKYGDLVPLEDIQYDGDNEKDVAVVITNRDRPDLTDQLVEQIQNCKGDLSIDIFVIEMGSTKRSKHESYHYEDPDFRGKAFGHNVGVRYAKARGRYRYYFTVMNDLEFTCKRGLERLVAIADRNPRVAILSPTEPQAGYAGGICKPVLGKDYQCVSQVNYLALLVRSEMIEQGLYLNPAFKYCWGAIHELSHKAYKLGYHVGYAGEVTMLHFGNSIYGEVKNVPSRREYLQNAQKFAARYMVEHYGKRWDEEFSSVLPEDMRHTKYNTYTRHRLKWEVQLSERERTLYHQMAKDETLRAKINSLNPWYYPVTIGDIQVTPGVGSRQSPDSLVNRTEFRREIMVDEVLRRYDFTGKRIADVASNCAYWTARYAENGADSMVAIEGRHDYVEQGRLYWGNNSFLPDGKWEFVHGNVMEPALWRNFADQEFDFILCAGILYHIRHPQKLLELMASKAKEVMLLDTRVSVGQEVQEEGGWHFDAIVETSNKVIPTRKSLVAALERLGFSAETIKTEKPVPSDMSGKDNYNKENRITLLARRV